MSRMASPRTANFGKWSMWSDLHLLIEEHENHTGAMEGMGAYSSDPYDGPDPLAPPGWLDGADEGEGTDAEGAAEEEVGGEANAGGEDDGGEANAGGDGDAGDEAAADSDDDTNSFAEDHDSGDDDSCVLVGCDAEEDATVETVEGSAEAFVSAHSHVVPAVVITEADAKTTALNFLLDVVHKEGNDPFTKSMRKVLLADEEKKKL